MPISPNASSGAGELSLGKGGTLEFAKTIADVNLGFFQLAIPDRGKFAVEKSVIPSLSVRRGASGTDFGTGSDAGEAASLDLQQLFDRCMGHLPLVDRLIHGFRQSLTAQLPLIVAAAEGGDLPALERQAHRLKGEAANLGAIEISVCAARLETAVSHTISESRVLVGQLARASERFLASTFTFDSLPRPSTSAVDALSRLRGAFRS